MILPEASIPDRLMLTFESQSCQFERKGSPGLEHRTERCLDGRGVRVVIDTLLWRNRHGDVVGILYHYNDDSYERDGRQLEKAGNVNVFVRADSRKQGIGRNLVTEAVARWPIDFQQQSYTAAGRALAAKVAAGVSPPR